MSKTIMVEKRGGKRAGAGRKSIFELGQKKRREIIEIVERELKKHGTSFGQELANLIRDRKDKRTKLAAMKLYSADILPKISEKDLEDENRPLGPAVFLPEQHPRLGIIKDDQ